MDTDLEAAKAFEKSLNVNADAMIKMLRKALDDEQDTTARLRKAAREQEGKSDWLERQNIELMRRYVELYDRWDNYDCPHCP
jgi:bacterioferritin (cytochrome b1)